MMSPMPRMSEIKRMGGYYHDRDADHDDAQHFSDACDFLLQWCRCLFGSFQHRGDRPIWVSMPVAVPTARPAPCVIVGVQLPCGQSSIEIRAKSACE